MDQLKKEENHNLPFSIYQGALTQLHNSFILASTNRGFILINQQLAHERILYDRLVAAAHGKSIATQRSLFPVTLQLSAQDAAIFSELMIDLNQLGYEIEPFGNQAFVVQGTPADVVQGNEKKAIDDILEQYKHFSSEVKFSKRERLIRSLAWQQSIKPGKALTQTEMVSLTDDLFNCQQPNITAGGSPTYIEFKKDYLDQLFKR
jgi:DNA mismatch repair protein MutL